MIPRADPLATRWFPALLALVAAIPLLWPQVPPLIDLMGHMGRYRVETARDVPALAAAYGFEWRLIGNLGIDLLIVPMAELFGVELGTKLIVLAIPPLTVGGLLWLSREVHGRIEPHSLFALPLAYAFPFQFGFVNFALSLALALPALALWIRLGRKERLRLRAGLFAVLALFLWVMHMVGWGLLGISAFGAEFVRLRRKGEPLFRAGLLAALACLPLATALVPMLLVRSSSPEAVSWDFFNWRSKLFWISSLLRERWQLWDLIGSWTMLLLIFASWRLSRFRIDPLLGVPALLCLIVFLAMPRVAVGSAYADMRLLPWLCALALVAVAVRPERERLGRWLAGAGLAFFLLRIGGTTISFLMYDASFRSELRALDHVPRSASVLALVQRPCRWEWSTPRLDHLPSMAIVRRDAFTNDQWAVDNAQLISIRKQGVGPFARDPSQMIYPKWCRGGEGQDLDLATATFPRDAFDYLWAIRARPGEVRQPDLTLVWTNGLSTLYRVDRIATSETPAGSGTRPTR